LTKLKAYLTKKELFGNGIFYWLLPTIIWKRVTLFNIWINKF